MKAIPTLLTTSRTEFVEQMDVFQRHFSRIQLDIGDGNLVPNVTTQIDEMIHLIEENEVTVFPSVSFDFHLMVQDFEQELEKIQKIETLGMKVDTALVNAALHPDIPHLSSRYDFTIGLDIFPETTIQEMGETYDLDYLSALQVMTVNPGFQGSPFLEEMLIKIEQLRKLNYKDIIMIDGGVNEATIPIISSKDYKPDYLCIGSYLTKAGEKLEERVKILNKL